MVPFVGVVGLLRGRAEFDPCPPWWVVLDLSPLAGHRPQSFEAGGTVGAPHPLRQQVPRDGPTQPREFEARPAGIGIAGRVVRDCGLSIGDLIIVSGTLGDHGIAIMAHREGFDFGGQIQSDVSPLWPLVERALAAGEIHAMKDPTRGGFANAINEMARKSGVGVIIDEVNLPIRASVRSAAGMLGIDPLEVANEGKVVMGVAPDDAETVLEALRSHPYGREAAIIGRVVEGSHVVRRTTVGGERFIEPPIGDPVPRVC